MVTILEIFRTAKGFSASGFSRELKLSHSVITQIENGLPAWPKLQGKISEFFGVNKEILFESGGQARKIKSDDVLSLIITHYYLIETAKEEAKQCTPTT